MSKVDPCSECDCCIRTIGLRQETFLSDLESLANDLSEGKLRTIGRCSCSEWALDGDGDWAWLQPIDREEYEGLI